MEYRFRTDNYYIKYKLFDHLNMLNKDVFTSGYTFLPNFTLEQGYFSISGTSVSGGNILKVSSNSPSSINHFRKNTFINLIINNAKHKSLITDLVENEYFMVETSKEHPSVINIDSFETIYELGQISEILYDVYINRESNYYRVRDHNRRRDIANAYALFISEDINVINYTTAILMQDEEHKFVLKVYDPENIQNGGVTRPPTVFTLSADPGMNYATVYGEVTNNGGSAIKEWGAYTGTTMNPLGSVNSDTVVNGQPGIFETTIAGNTEEGLTPETTYYFKSYATNKDGTSFGRILSFRTLDAVDTPPKVITLGVDNKYSRRFNINGRVATRGYDSSALSGITSLVSRGVKFTAGINTDPSTYTDTLIYPDPSPAQINFLPYYCTATGLTKLSVYSYAAFATNIIVPGFGTGYGATGTTTTLDSQQPTININSTVPTYNSMVVNCELTFDDDYPCTELGACMTTSSTVDPTISDEARSITSTSFTPPYTYSLNFTGLTSNTIYYIRPYAVNSEFSPAYGTRGNKKTNLAPIAPTLTNIICTPTDITCSISSDVTNTGNLSLTSRKIYYSSINPATTSDPFVEQNPPAGGVWQTTISSLVQNTTYYLLFVTSNGVMTSNDTYSFTTSYTPVLPTVTTTVVSNNAVSAEISSNVTSSGYATVTSRGVAYALTPLPTTPTIAGGSGTGSWTTNITGLLAGNTYYVRSYAVNSAGTGWSSDQTFTTTALPPAVSVNISNITLTTALVNTTYTTSGTVSSRGIYWGTTNPPTNHIPDNTSNPSFFVTNLVGLTSGTVYYVKSYVIDPINGEGSANTTFTSAVVTIPTVSVSSVSDIEQTSAIVNCNIDSNGFGTITENGVWYSGSTTGYTTATVVQSGSFSVSLTPLTQNTEYFVEAYAINAVGTGWSTHDSFTTLITNNATIKLTLSPNPTTNIVIYDDNTYEVGGYYAGIVSSIVVTPGNLPLSDLISGSVVYGTIPTTSLTWGAGVTTATNVGGTTTTYTTTSGDPSNHSVTFLAEELCGSPVVSKTDTVIIKSFYSFLTCNRTPRNRDPILTLQEIINLCGNGNFYIGAIDPNPYDPDRGTGEPMLRYLKYDSDDSSKVITITYNITSGKNLIYFAHKVDATYGNISNIDILYSSGTVPTTFTEYPIIPMQSKNLYDNWLTDYDVYSFFVVNGNYTVDIRYTFI